MSKPHPDTATRSVTCAVITVSDTRTKDTDRSGQLIQQLLAESQHTVGFYKVLKDEPDDLRTAIAFLQQRSDIEVLLFNGGTGISPRDRTYDAIVELLDKSMPGFGELFRMLSYAEIGSRAMASRAIAGTIGHQVLFSMPGSTGAVKLAMEKLILPEMVHLTGQLNGPLAPQF